MSNTTPHARLAAALSEMQSPKADKVNPAFRSKYASLDCIMDTVRPILAKHGLAIMQIPYNSEGRVGVKTVIVHSEGLIELGNGIDVATKPDTKAQDVGAIITYLRRQTVQAAMGIATDLDDDGNSVSQPAASPEPARSWKGGSRA